MVGAFEKSVFINCPFDEDYDPILQAILFCVLYLGFSPRISRERTNSAEVRVDNIRSLIESAKYSIHDLSRCQAKRRGEHFRLNMPFELGMDYACRSWFGNGREDKTLLILEEKPYRYQAVLSDLSGCDIGFHGGNYQKAVRKVRNWFVNETWIAADPPTRILARYAAFQGWYYDRQIAAGSSDEDIRDYPTNELLMAMQDWLAIGQPLASGP